MEFPVWAAGGLICTDYRARFEQAPLFYIHSSYKAVLIEVTFNLAWLLVPDWLI